MLRAGVLLTGLRPKQVVAVLCLLAVAFVAAFHSIGSRATSWTFFDVTAIQAVSDDGAPAADRQAVEACHVCTVIAAPDDIGAGRLDPGLVPASPTTRLVSVLPKTLGPPPKA